MSLPGGCSNPCGEEKNIDIIGPQSFEALYTTIDEVVTVVATVFGLFAGGQIRLGG